MWCDQNRPNAKNLSHDGFFFINMNDCTVRIYCGNVEFGWVAKDEPLERHLKNYPECCKKRAAAKLSIAEIQSAHPRYTKFETREQDFSNRPVQIAQKPARMADAGLFYSGHGDRVVCFFCDGNLFDWEPNDIPLVEHVKHLPNCAFAHSHWNGMPLALVKKFSSSNNCESSSLQKTSYVTSEQDTIVKMALEGYSEESIKEILTKYQNSITVERNLPTYLELLFT